MDWRSAGKSMAFCLRLICRLIVANRATHNAHAGEMASLEKQINEWKLRIACEEKGEPFVPPKENEMEEEEK